MTDHRQQQLSQLLIDKQFLVEEVEKKRLEIQHLRHELQKYQQQNGSQLNQNKLKKLEHQISRFNTAKVKLHQTLQAILLNFKLEAQNLKKHLLGSVLQCLDEIREFSLQIEKRLVNSTNIQSLRKSYDEIFMQIQKNHQNEIENILNQRDQQINQLFLRIDDLNRQIFESEQNELALLRLNKLQVDQIDKLKQKVQNETSNSLVILSKTSQSWSRQKEEEQQQFTRTQPRGFFSKNQIIQRNHSQQIQHNQPQNKYYIDLVSRYLSNKDKEN